jgi:hypothetical protein
MFGMNDSDKGMEYAQCEIDSDFMRLQNLHPHQTPKR